ncbi:hypothetical protein BSP9_070 [Bacillus phage BSP9]|nr:hypothetical protein BSP9_070 [Bacillus phage BSP9]
MGERIEELHNEIDSLECEVDMQLSINSEALFKKYEDVSEEIE